MKEAAWLARVNDDTIRTWTKHSKWPGPAAVDGEPPVVHWHDLDSFCRANNKRFPLPPAALALTSEDLADGTGGAATKRDAEGSPQPAADAPPYALGDAQAEAQTLRLALRERIVGAGHARADAAAADRALTHLLDQTERAGRTSGT